jgi:hypothetical protein
MGIRPTTHTYPLLWSLVRIRPVDRLKEDDLDLTSSKTLQMADASGEFLLYTEGDDNIEVKPMRVLLVDDQTKVVRSALRLLLEQEPGLSVVG